MNPLEQHRSEVEFFSLHPGEAFDESLQAVEFAVEPWGRVQPEVARLAPAHWREVTPEWDRAKCSPDWDRYADFERNGTLHLVTARSDGWLVGYHTSVLCRHLHCRELTAHVDSFFLQPEYRQGMVGYNMLKFFVASVKEKKAQRIIMAAKLPLSLDAVFQRLGFRETERLYTLVSE